MPFDPSKYPKGNWVIPRESKISYIEPKDATLINRIIMFIMKIGSHNPETLNVFKAFSHLKTANKFWFAFWISLYKFGSIKTLEKEKIILRTTWRTGNIYEFSQHMPFLVKGKLSKEEIDSLTEENSPNWDDKTKVIMIAVDEIVDRHMLSDESWDNIRKYYNEDQIMEFMMLVGHYIMIAVPINSAGIELESFAWLK